MVKDHGLEAGHEDKDTQGDRWREKGSQSLVFISCWLRHKNFNITRGNHSEACLYRDNILFPQTDLKQG